VAELNIYVPGQSQPVSAILEVPKTARALLVLAHGAGAGMRHPAMNALANALHARDLATLRFQFPYMECGSKRPDRPEVAVAAVAAAVRTAAEHARALPLFAGGKSFGGRMTTTAAAAGEISLVRGIICFGFPLHPAKKPATERAGHLTKVRCPTLFIQGTRDDLADLTLLRPVVARLPAFKLHVIDGADHSFGMLKSAGRSSADVLVEVAEVASAFCLEKR
jgi:predicted alpha/beta-hydrolase family hydrolase